MDSRNGDIWVYDFDKPPGELKGYAGTITELGRPPIMKQK